MILTYYKNGFYFKYYPFMKVKAFIKWDFYGCIGVGTPPFKALRNYVLYPLYEIKSFFVKALRTKTTSNSRHFLE